MQQLDRDVVSDERWAEAVKLLEEHPFILEWGHKDVVTKKMIQSFLGDKMENHDLTAHFFLEMYFLDYFDLCDFSNDRYHHALEILERNGLTSEESDELVDNNVFTECPVDMNISHYLDQDVNIRFELISNYDCMNSAWFESGSGQDNGIATEETYLGDVLRVLNIDPEDLNAVSESYTFAPLSDKSHLEDVPPLVDSRKFVEEFENTTCGANLLTFVMRLPFCELDRYFEDHAFVVPKGTCVGFYSSFQGGGSLFSCELLRDLEIQVRGKPSNEYPYWSMIADDAGREYSISACYGRGFWDGL